jgi:hypothetical protein
MQDYLDYLPYCDRIWIKQKVTRSNFHKFKILPTATKIPKSKGGRMAVGESTPSSRSRC